MDAKELMIGDYIYDLYGNKAIVRKLEDYNEHAKASGACIELVEGPEEGKTFCLYGQIEPIPLTPEILEENGFKKDPEYSDTYWRPDCRKFCFVKENDDWYFAIRYAGGHICIATCNYVYKLRHILRDLLEIEKEVVL